MDAVRLGFRFHPTIAGRLAGLERAIQAALRIQVATTMVRDMPAAVLRKGRGEPLWDGRPPARPQPVGTEGCLPGVHAAVRRNHGNGGGVWDPAVAGAGTRRTANKPAAPPRFREPSGRDRPHGRGRSEQPGRPAGRADSGPGLDSPGHTRCPAAYELPQAIGELSFTAGRGGILCPSARATTGRYMICFTTNLKQVGGVLRTVNPFTEREHRPP